MVLALDDAKNWLLKDFIFSFKSLDNRVQIWARY